MGSIVEKERERELSEYLEEWVAARYRKWREIYRGIFSDRHTGIYRLKSGEQLLQLLFDIIENIGEHFATEARRHIIPSKFSSIPQLLQFLDNFQEHIKNRYDLIERNMDGENTDIIVFDIFRICNDINEMTSRCLNAYLTDNIIPIPYQQALNALRNNNVDLFCTLISGFIKNIPYNIHKERLDEGYFHTIIHVIISVLGMSPLSEAETADGRIDMMIEFPNKIFILEFKYSANNQNRALEAIGQIKEKEYAKSYYIKGKTIYGVGISFSQETRNINGFKLEILYKPEISIYNYKTRQHE